MSPFYRIKRCCILGRVVFTTKADFERAADDLSRASVIEAVVNAPAIYKVLRSTSMGRTAARESVYVIIGITHESIVIYTKGALRRFAGEDYFYVFVSAKRSVDE